MPSKERKQAEAGNAEAQARMDQETEVGYRGVVPDPTPNEAYTVAGVTRPAPTPETDSALAREAGEAIDRAGEAAAPSDPAQAGGREG